MKKGRGQRKNRRNAAGRARHRALEGVAVVKLSPEAFKRVVELIESPPEPSERLKRAVEKWQAWGQRREDREASR